MSWAWLDSTESWIQTCRSMGVFFPPPIVCRVPCWELQPLESYGTVISQRTELIRWTASTQEGSRQANLPAREQTARGKPFPHALQPKDSRPHDPSSPKLPAPHTVSPGSVLLARKQLQGQDLKARAICILYVCLTASWASLKPRKFCIILRKASPGHACRWNQLVPKVALGLPLITCVICTGSRRTMFKLKTVLKFFLSLVFAHGKKSVKSLRCFWKF